MAQERDYSQLTPHELSFELWQLVDQFPPFTDLPPPPEDTSKEAKIRYVEKINELIGEDWERRKRSEHRGVVMGSLERLISQSQLTLSGQ